MQAIGMRGTHDVTSKSARRPNVLFIIADDHRADALGCAGDPTVRTPYLDALAERGVTFDRTYHMGGLSVAVCVPARAALLTGTNPFSASTSQRVDDLPGLMALRPELPTLPETLQRAGYHTHGIGKWHNDPASFARSFTSAARVFFGGMSEHTRVPLHDEDPTGKYPAEARYIGEEFSTELFCDAAMQFLNGYQDEQPFFLYLALTSPHDPRTPPPPYDQMYEAARMPLPPNVLLEHPFDNGEMRVRDELLAPFPRPPEVVRQHLADYYGMITHHDAWLGRLFDVLQARGHADNTIVVYTADHGLAVGQHGLMGKQNLYEHSVRVPLIVGGPDLPRGQRVDGLTYTPDVYPTLCELAGVAVPPTVEMRSLLPAIASGNGHDSVCSVYKDRQRMVSDGTWKLIRYYRAPELGVGEDRVQLFNVAADPWETRDRSTEPEQMETLHNLAAALTRWQHAENDP
jgi:arylsulfatase A-like enzyme